MFIWDIMWKLRFVTRYEGVVWFRGRNNRFVIFDGWIYINMFLHFSDTFSKHRMLCQPSIMFTMYTTTTFTQWFWITQVLVFIIKRNIGNWQECNTVFLFESVFYDSDSKWHNKLLSALPIPTFSSSFFIWRLMRREKWNDTEFDFQCNQLRK